MDTPKQLTPYSQQQALQEAQQQERFTNRTVNVVVVTLTLVAYLPLLLDAQFYELSLWRMLFLLGLGLLYAFVGTAGMTWCEAQSPLRPWLMTAYFVVQIAIIAGLFWTIDDLDNNVWLLILPVGAQSLALPRWGTAVVCFALLASIYIIFLQDIPVIEAVQIMLQIGAAMLFTVLFTYIAIRESTARYRIQHLATELHNANVRLAEYAAQAEELATIKERNRLAREIHDNLGHYLTVVHVQIEAARAIMPENPDKAADALNKAQKLTQEGLTAIRHSISALRESPLENQSLPEIISKLVQETHQSGIMTTLKVLGDPIELDAKTSLTFYRVAQEGLTNIRKHARASRADVLLDYTQPDQVTVTITDNGVGTAVNTTGAAPGVSFGLMGIRERMQLLGGEMHYTTAPGAGFTLTVVAPIATR